MSERLTGPFRIFAACAAGSNEICLSLVPRELERGYPFARLASYVSGHWEIKDVPFAVSSIAAVTASGSPAKLFQILAETGETFVFDHPNSIVRIGEAAGARSATERPVGYFNSITQIEDDLFVVGDRAQVYRRTGGIWLRLGAEMEEEIDEDEQDDDILELLRNPSLLRDKQHMREHRRKFREGTPINFWCLAGKSGDDFYVGGGRGNLERVLMHWNGSAFSSVIAAPVDPNEYTASLTDLLIGHGDQVWACGHRGALLEGNYQEGFQMNRAAGVDALFQSMTLFGGKLHLASEADIYRHEGDRLSRIRPSAKRQDQGAFYIHGVENTLWVVSPNDLLRYDGVSWESLAWPSQE